MRLLGRSGVRRGKPERLHVDKWALAWAIRPPALPLAIGNPPPMPLQRMVEFTMSTEYERWLGACEAACSARGIAQAIELSVFRPGPDLSPVTPHCWWCSTQPHIG